MSLSETFPSGVHRNSGASNSIKGRCISLLAPENSLDDATSDFDFQARALSLGLL
jgi:hypothetical protein